MFPKVRGPQEFRNSSFGSHLFSSGPFHHFFFTFDSCLPSPQSPVIKVNKEQFLDYEMVSEFQNQEMSTAGEGLALSRKAEPTKGLFIEGGRVEERIDIG